MGVIQGLCKYVSHYNNVPYLSALNDWRLSQCVNGEYFCDYIYNLTYEQIERTLKLANGILERNEESIKTLMEALVI